MNNVMMNRKELKMSHLVENMMYVGELPWHGLGKPVSNDLTVEEALEASGANFTISKRKEYVRIKDKYIPTGKYSLVRDDNNKILTSVSAEWNDIPNKEAFEFFREWIEEGSMHLHTAGVLDDGRMVWAMAKTNEGFSLFNGKDRIESNLLFSLPHVYGKSTIVMGTDIRVVCNNTLQYALSNGKADMMVKIHHRKTFDADQIKQALNINRAKNQLFKEAAEFLVTKKAKKEDVSKFFNTIFPMTSNKKEKEDAVSRNAKLMEEILETQPGAELGAGTWWQAFNAITYATDHLIGNKDESRLMSAFYGAGRNRKIEALKLATEMAAA